MTKYLRFEFTEEEFKKALKYKGNRTWKQVLMGKKSEVIKEVDNDDYGKDN